MSGTVPLLYRMHSPRVHTCANSFYVRVKRFVEETFRNLLGRVSFVINLLQPSGHVMHQQINIHQLYVLSTHCIYVFCIYLRTDSDLCHLQHKLIGFYNRDEKCLLRGTN